MRRCYQPLGNLAVATETGSAPLSLALGLGLLVVPVLLLVLTIPTWESRMVDARDAAVVASRALVTSDSWPDGVAAARQVVSEMAGNDNLSQADLRVTCSGDLARGGEISVRVTVILPAGTVPGIGAFGGFHYSATSVQHVDEYRSFG